MADLKISQLTGATTPLAGTEVLPVVQSSTTKKVSVANLTAGRVVEVAQLNLISGDTTAEILLKDTGTTNYYVRVKSRNNTMELVSGNGVTATLDASNNIKFEVGNLVQGTAAKGINFTANTPAAGMTSQLLNWYEEGTCSITLTAGLGTITSSSVTANYTRVGRLVTVTGQLSITNNGTGAGYLNLIGLPFTPAAPAAGIGREGVNNGLADVIYISSGSTTCQMYTTTNTYPVATGSTVNFSMSYIV